MKSKKSILSIAIFLLIAFVIAGCGVIPTQPKGAIEGRVLVPPSASEMSKDVSGWVPAAGATVTVVDANGVTHTVTTDEDGYYSFENIAVNPNTVVTATVTVDGKTVVLKGVIPQSVAADEDYNAGTMTPESTALALVVEKLIDEGISHEDIALAEIQASETFADLVEQVTTAIEEEKDVTEDPDVTGGAGDIADEILNPPAPPSPPTIVSVTSVSIDQEDQVLLAGNTLDLTATIEPANATNKNILWASDDESIAAVADGVITAVAVGTVTITVTTEDGSKTDTIEITVANVVNTTQIKGYETIDTAIKDAETGDTIEIGTGTYNETIAIDEQLTLKGKSDLSSIITGVITISTGNVTLDSLNIDATGTFPTHDSAVLSQPEASGVVTIKNCQIHVDRNGITMLGDQNTVITDNQILSIASSERATNGIQAGYLSDTVNEEINLTLSGNTVTGNEYLNYDSTYYSSGILVKTNGNITAGNTTLDAGLQANAEAVYGLIMSNNTVSDNDVSCWIFNPETGSTWKMEFGGKRYYISQLTDLVESSETKISISEEIGEGAYHGKFPIGSIGDFQEVIDAANTILENKDDYSAEEIEVAYENLQTAKNTFESSIYYQYPPTSVGITPAIIFDGETANLEIELPDVSGEWLAILVEMDDVQQGWHFVQDGGSNDQDGSADSSVLFDIAGVGTDYTDPGEYTVTVYAANFEITAQAQLDADRFEKSTSVEIKEGPRLDVIYVGSQPAPDGKARYDNLDDAVAAINDGGTIYIQSNQDHSIPTNMSIDRNITIEGLGTDPSDTVLTQSNGASKQYIFNVDTGKEFAISNLKIDGNDLASNGIISSAGDLTIENLVFQNSSIFTIRGIVLKEGCESALIDNFQLSSGIKNTGNSIQINSTFSGTAEITNCFITGGERGISIGSSDATVTISDNTINSSSVGVYVTIGATVNDIISSAENVDEVKTEINSVTTFTDCVTDIEME